jgi:dTDP-4-amino-4,6-dideoxygalactose transaminase
MLSMTMRSDIMSSKRVFLSPPHMAGEEMEFVRQAFESNYIAPVGPMVDAFEEEFAAKVGAAYAVAVASGTAAMHLALRLLDVGPGDEVYGATLTFIGSVSPITFMGAVPVFIDCERSSWNMDPDLLADELDRGHRRGLLPKAVVPTDLYGQCADMDRILAVCRRYEVPVIVDAAEALGARYKCRQAGQGAKAAVFSFNGNKIITTSGGGMLVSDDRRFIEQARFLSQQARDPAPHYEHSRIGYNYRMSNIVAAIGRGQLLSLEERVERKREIFEYYRDALEPVDGITMMPEAAYGQCTRWLTVILIDPRRFGAGRETVRLALEAVNIESRPVWKPMHLQKAFCVDANLHGASPVCPGDRYPARTVGGHVAEELFDRGLCLPSGTAMTQRDLDRVVHTIVACRDRHGL